MMLQVRHLKVRRSEKYVDRTITAKMCINDFFVFAPVFRNMNTQKISMLMQRD